MAVHLRLQRYGKKGQPFYRIVATDSRRARDGRFLEVVGTYNPVTKPAQVKVEEALAIKWLDQGAEPSDTVKSLFRQIGLGEKIVRAKRGEDVSTVVLKEAITERRKRTRKVKKAALAASEAKASAPAEGSGE